MHAVQPGSGIRHLPFQQQQIDSTSLKTQLFAVWFFASLIAFAVGSNDVAIGVSLLSGAVCLLSYYNKKGEEQALTRANRVRLRHLAASTAPAAGIAIPLATQRSSQPQPNAVGMGVSAPQRAPVDFDYSRPAPSAPIEIHPIPTTGNLGESNDPVEQKGGSPSFTIADEVKGASSKDEPVESKGAAQPSGRGKPFKQGRKPMNYAGAAARNNQRMRGRGRG